MAVVPTDVTEVALPLIDSPVEGVDSFWKRPASEILEDITDRFWLGLDFVFFTEPTELNDKIVIGAAATGFFASVGGLLFFSKKETPLTERMRLHLRRRALWTLLGTGITVASAAATIQWLVPVMPEWIVGRSYPRLGMSVLPGALLVGTVVTPRKRVVLKRALWMTSHMTLPLAVFFSQILVPTWTSYMLMNTGFSLISLVARTEEQLFWLGSAVMALAAPYPPWLLLQDSQEVSTLSLSLGLFTCGAAIWYETTRVLECGDRKAELDYANRSFGPYKRVIEIFVHFAKSALFGKKKKKDAATVPAPGPAQPRSG